MVNHAHQAHRAAIVGRVDFGDARLVKRANFGRRNGATAASKDTDMLATRFVKQLSNVGEVFHVAALIGRQGNGVSVFLYGAVDHGFGRLVVAKVNHFSP